MTERPILFSGEMVNAIRDGRKTQTRRVIKTAPDRLDLRDGMVMYRDDRGWRPWLAQTFSPYGVTGDRLWVRETFQISDNVVTKPVVFYAADEQRETSEWPNGLWNVDKWRPSIFMPRWASRLTLEVAAVRVERLQDISEADIAAEGVVAPTFAIRNCWTVFSELWDRINGKRATWASDPWVWVVEFSKATP